MGITVTITGPEGSGKTTFAEWLRRNMPHSIRRPYQREETPFDVTIIDGGDGDRPPVAEPAVDKEQAIAAAIRATLDAAANLINEAQEMGLTVRVDVGKGYHFSKTDYRPRNTVRLECNITKSL